MQADEVQGFTQDDAHVFLPEQINDEILRIPVSPSGFSTFDFKNYEINLSTRGEIHRQRHRLDLQPQGLIELLSARAGITRWMRRAVPSMTPRST